MSDNEENLGDQIADNSRYSHEQKIVAAVWVHEKDYNDQTWKDIETNFVIRFNLPAPNRSTFMNWEKKLFSKGNVENREKSGRPLSRLMHVPYVKASLKEAPDMSVRERSRSLGLPSSTLLRILRDDLNMEFEADETNTNPRRKHAPYNDGKWKEKNEETSSTQ